MIYSVIDKQTNQEVYRYESTAPIEWNGMEFLTHSHIEVPAIAVDSAANSVPVRTWLPHEFRRLFTVQEQENILAASKNNISIENYLKDLDMAPAVRSDDPLVVSALPLLESSGLIGTGRAQEILNG